MKGSALVVHAMGWPDEIRDPTELLPPPADVSDDVIEGALALMEAMAHDDLEGEEFQDRYTEAMEQIIEATREHHAPRAPDRKPDGRILCARESAFTARVEDYITWASQEAAARGLAREVIPPDPRGRIGTERFRRSLAWHIARRPGGLVALAIQYGHLRTSVAAGYAARSRDGIHDLLDVETARATTDTVADLNAALEDGVGI
ncbi:hypothetical protein AB0E10_41325 [Streptomyces sp. NPDC048045]|uniref:hypothetical protein n=1 Tax=Streptomyces sp. NPDC048045 TaxID=3154710 RepID=UPI0034175942